MLTPIVASTLRITGILATACVLLLPAGVQANSIYKCVDLDGRTTYSSIPCGELELTDAIIKERDWSGSRSSHARTPGAAGAPGIPAFGEARPIPEDEPPYDQPVQPEPELGPST